MLCKTCVSLMKLGNLGQPFLIFRGELGRVILLRVLPQKREVMVILKNFMTGYFFNLQCQNSHKI